MKKYPKLVQCDKRGQIVIPKDIRQALKIEEGTGFFVYAIEGEGILLKKVEPTDLEFDPAIRQLKDKSKSTGISEKKIDSTVKKYKKTKEGNLEYV